MFRCNFIGNDPYITCNPFLRHHKLGPQDRFLVLSSDGLYQYLSNEEVVSLVEWFMEKNPEGDPAQHLIEELLFRAAKKNGITLQPNLFVQFPHSIVSTLREAFQNDQISMTQGCFRQFLL